MGNARNARFRASFEKLAANEDPMVAEHPRWAMEQTSKVNSR